MFAKNLNGAQKLGEHLRIQGTHDDEDIKKNVDKRHGIYIYKTFNYVMLSM